MTSDEIFEVYLRDQDGQTYYTDARSGMKRFLSEEGYRITFNIEGMAITLRRGVDMSDPRLDDWIAQVSENVTLSIRGLDLESSQEKHAL